MSDFRDRDPVHAEPAGVRGPADGDAESTVHQVVFRWEGNHGRQDTGMNAVARSCSAERAEEVGRDLGRLLWVSGAAAERHSVVRALSRDGDVLLVQRWPTTDRAGRRSTVSQVLIGAPKTLKTYQCLGLSYRGWGDRDAAERATGRLDPIPCAELDARARRRLPGMVDALPTVEHALILVAAEWLRDPTQRVSLLTQEQNPPGWPDRDTTPLVCLGLYLLFGSWLGGKWTFATYDAVDTHPLRLMCVPHWEAEAGGAGGPLARVMGRQPSKPGFEHRAAARLVEHLLAHPDAGPGVPQLVDELRDGALLDWPQRRARLQEIIDADRTDHAHRTGHADRTDRTTKHPTARAAAPAHHPPAPASPPASSPAPYPEPVSTPPPPPSPPPPASPPPPVSPATAPSWAHQEHGTGSAAPDGGGPGPDVRALHRALLDHRRDDLVQRSTLRAQLGGLPDEVLLDELCSGELPQDSVELLLDELGLPRRVHARRKDVQRALCAEVLRKGLYFPPYGQDAEGASRMGLAVRAAQLFTWAVAPLAREERYLLDLRELVHRMGRDRHPTAGTWIWQSIITPANGEVPDLPPTVWQLLLRDMISRNDGPPADAPPPDAPAAREATTSPDTAPDASGPHAGTGRLSELIYHSGCLVGAIVLLFAMIITIIVLLA